MAPYSDPVSHAPQKARKIREHLDIKQPWRFMDELWHHGEEFNCLPSPCGNPQYSLHGSQNSSRYKLIKDIIWEVSCTEPRLTLPNALDIIRPTKRMAERSASSYERRHASEGKWINTGIVSLPSWCTISTTGTSTPDKTQPATDN